MIVPGLDEILIKTTTLFILNSKNYCSSITKFESLVLFSKAVENPEISESVLDLTELKNKFTE